MSLKATASARELYMKVLEVIKRYIVSYIRLYRGLGFYILKENRYIYIYIYIYIGLRGSRGFFFGFRV